MDQTTGPVMKHMLEEVMQMMFNFTPNFKLYILPSPNVLTKHIDFLFRGIASIGPNDMYQSHHC